MDTRSTAGSELLIGRVEDYDFERGLGEVADAEGRTWLFHCTALVDGTRRIEPGRAVAFVVGAGGPGRWEAQQVTPL
jgi:cold shock CspA family protein